MMVDWWAHRHVDDPKLATELIADDFDADVAEMATEAAALDALPDDFEVVTTKSYGAER